MGQENTNSFEGKGVSGVEEEEEGEREDSLTYLSTHIHAYITVNQLPVVVATV